MQGIWTRRVRRTTLISVGSAAFLVGVGVAPLGWAVPMTAAAAGAGLLLLCRGRLAWLAIPAVAVAGCMFGLWRGGIVQANLHAYLPLVDHKVAISGVVAQDSTYGGKGQIDFMINHVVYAGHALPGQVRVTSFSAVEPKQGDIIEATAKLKPGFGNYQAGLYYAQVSVRERSGSWLTTLRRDFSAAVLNVVPEPQASLGLGFLLGIKSQLPDALNDQLKIVGLTHIVVASGYNLTILVRAARRALVKRSKFQATAAAVGLMAGFVGVTGLSPSMSRAALVTSLSLAAWYYGRVVHPFVLLLFSAAMTVAVNPLYVWGDLGWYLSFLAFGGVMIGAPLLQKRLFGKREAPQLAQIVLETFCAELVTLPLTLWVFGSVSVVALAANILVVPLIPVAMLATFVAGLSFLFLPAPATWLALPAHWLLGYMTAVVSWLASIPWAKAPLGLSLASMGGVYAMVCALGWVMYKRLRYDYLSRGFVE